MSPWTNCVIIPSHVFLKQTRSAHQAGELPFCVVSWCVYVCALALALR